MSSNIILSVEEKFLINILFTKKKIKREIFEMIDYEKIIKIASSHLMLPAFYINLKKKNYLNKIPKELRIYLEKIFKLNKERNQILIEEIKEISILFNKNKINYVFLKGSAQISANYYQNIGERMIGDIDILISKEDYQKSIKLMLNSNYKKKSGYKELVDFKIETLKHKHYPKLINNKKVFAVEIHNKLLNHSNNKLLNIRDILNTKIKNKEGLFIPNDEYIFKHIIYNNQINDNCSLFASYNFRSLYDMTIMLKNINYNKLKDNKLKYVQRFMIISDLLGITKHVKNPNYKNLIYKFRFKIKTSNKAIYTIDNYICKLYLFINIKLKQIFELIINKKYSSYLIHNYLNQD